MEQYLPLLVQTLRFPSSITTIEQYFTHVHSRPSRDGISWASRVSNWNRLGIKLYNPQLRQISSETNRICLPVFPPLWDKAIKEQPIMLETTVNIVIDQNKEAGMLAAELSVGRAANEFIMAKLIKTLPWYKRLFVNKEGNSWLGKLVVAQATNAIVQQTSNNEKLQKIAGAMLKESVVEATVYSDQLTGLIAGLEAAVSVPHLDKLLGKS